MTLPLRLLKQVPVLILCGVLVAECYLLVMVWAGR